MTEWATEQEKREQWERETRGNMMDMARSEFLNPEAAPAPPRLGPSPLASADYRRLPDDSKVRVWRVHEMFQAGLRDVKVARELAAGHYDLHEICAAIREGCPPDLLRKIFT